MLSDHKPILFSMSLPSLPHVSTKASSMSRVYSLQFSESFSQCFTKSCSHLLLDFPLADLDADEHLSLLNSTWLDVLNETVSLKPDSKTQLLRQVVERLSVSGRRTIYTSHYSCSKTVYWLIREPPNWLRHTIFLI